MESIDKLREYADFLENVASTSHIQVLKPPTHVIRRLADAIEREVDDNERFRREAEPFHDRLCRASERREDVTLWGVDYTALPLDAEGEPIHVGDVMEWPDGSTAEVVGIGDGTFFYVEDGEDAAEWSSASGKIHHRAPTVEDVLREFALACEDAGNSGPEVERIAAEYAAKLRLAEEVDE